MVCWLQGEFLTEMWLPRAYTSNIKQREDEIFQFCFLKLVQKIQEKLKSSRNHKWPGTVDLTGMFIRFGSQRFLSAASMNSEGRSNRQTLSSAGRNRFPPSCKIQWLHQAGLSQKTETSLQYFKKRAFIQEFVRLMMKEPSQTGFSEEPT